MMPHICAEGYVNFRTTPTRRLCLKLEGQQWKSYRPPEEFYETLNWYVARHPELCKEDCWMHKLVNEISWRG